MPDSVTFGCPAPRLGLHLASLSTVLVRDACFARLGLLEVYIGVRGKLTEVQFPELLKLSYE